MVLCRKVFQYFCVGFTVISVISISIIIYYQNLPRNHFLHDIEVVHGHLECEDPYDVVGNFMRYRLQIYPLRNLSTIDLSFTTLGDLAFEKFQLLNELGEHDKTILEMACTDVRDEQLRELCDVKYITGLNLMNCPFLTEKGLVELRRMPKLEILYLNETAATDQVCQELGATSICRIMLDDTDISGDYFHSQYGWKELRSLSLVHCPLSPSFLEKVVTLPKLDWLRISEYPGLQETLLRLPERESPLSIYVVHDGTVEHPSNEEMENESPYPKGIKVRYITNREWLQNQMIWLHPFCLLRTNYFAATNQLY
ncbi:MAG: hypothetical protein PHE53_12590 [Thermoguttaceae bacterium]|nr:hypothetical protein [Thermoguttaceae bacterium]